MDVRAERAARNEDLFRTVNERIEAFTAEHPEQWFEAICECSNLDCSKTIRIGIAAYEYVRSCAGCFVLLEGHDEPDFERIVERGDGYVVAEKIGEGARVARELDPRA